MSAAKTVEPRCGRRPDLSFDRDDAARCRRKREGDVGPRHGKPAHHVRHGRLLGVLGFEEFEARGRGEKKIAHLDARARGERSRRKRALHAARHGQLPGLARALLSACEGKPRHGGDRGQGFAAEAERCDGVEIVARKLGGRVTLDGEQKIVRRHAFAVVGDDNEVAAAAFDGDLDAARACVDRVLDKLLDHARRPLDHLARGDAIDEAFGQAADRHDTPSFRYWRVRIFPCSTAG